MPVYLITGANRGIGLEFVRQLAASPDNTILSTSRSTTDDATADLRAVASPTTHVLALDLEDLDSIGALTQKATRILRSDGSTSTSIDVLVNNAGVNLASDRISLALDPDSLLRQIRINALGPTKLVERLLAADLLSPSARVVSLTSGLGSLARSAEIRPRKCAAYSASKAALNMLSVHLAYDLRYHVLDGVPRLPGAVVVVVDPGWVKTRLGGKGAVLEAEESVSKMLRLVRGLKDEDNGKFFSYLGEEIPW